MGHFPGLTNTHNGSNLCYDKLFQVESDHRVIESMRLANCILLGAKAAARGQWRDEEEKLPESIERLEPQRWHPKTDASRAVRTEKKLVRH
mmetsp:Transcript_9160/g.18146  ORF Transcript_9160/g.18146 Transcript_9160/m.18146 type:complete len:91 (+) Transcript_9160:318-590(+)